MVFLFAEIKKWDKRMDTDHHKYRQVQIPDPLK